jgi:hypothetical protein
MSQEADRKKQKKDSPLQGKAIKMNRIGRNTRRKTPPEKPGFPMRENPEKRRYYRENLKVFLYFITVTPNQP